MMRLRVAGLATALLFALASRALALPATCPHSFTFVGGCTFTTTLWVPDFYDGQVYGYSFITKIGGLQSPVLRNNGPGFNALQPIPTAGYNCAPNSLAILGNYLYVVCSSLYATSGPGGTTQVINPTDEIVVFNITQNPPTYVSTISDPNFQGSGLVGSAFDAHGNLWLAGYQAGGGGGALMRIPTPDPTGHPAVDTIAAGSPGQPAGIAVSAFDNSIWVVGQYANGIVVNFPDSVLNVPGGNLNLNPSPTYCVASTPLAGCQQLGGNAFSAPEGVAIMGCQSSSASGCTAYYVWVSNNGGNAPPKTIVRLTAGANNQLSDWVTYGKNINKPFACPGGMFSSGQNGPLWVNDEGYGVPNTDCGASNADRGGKMGRVLQFPLSSLVGPGVKVTSPAPWTGNGATSLLTSSPGFGGIVESYNEQ
jgi:hypothetical protein